MRRRESVETMPSAVSCAGAREGRLVDSAMNATIIDGGSRRLLCPCIFGSPTTVGSAATHEHAGHRSCYFNGHFGLTRGTMARRGWMV